MKRYGLLIGSWFLIASPVRAANPFETDDSITFVAPPTLEQPFVQFQDQEWRGLRSGVTTAAEKVFYDGATWTQFWTEQIAPFQSSAIPVPAIDFTTESVIGVFRGQKPYASFDIEFVSIEKNAAGLTVKYKNIDRLVGMSSPRYAIQPFHLKKIPAVTGSVHFERVKEK